MRRSARTALVGLVAIGCANSAGLDEGGVLLVTRQPVYPVNGVVRAFLINRTPHEVWTGPCPTWVDVLLVRRWRDVPHSQGCPDVVLTIRPGEAGSVTRVLEDVPPGIYRIRHGYTVDGRWREAQSEPFVVRAERATASIR